MHIIMFYSRINVEIHCYANVIFIITVNRNKSCDLKTKVLENLANQIASLEVTYDFIYSTSKEFMATINYFSKNKVMMLEPSMKVKPIVKHPLIIYLI